MSDDVAPLGGEGAKGERERKWGGWLSRASESLDSFVLSGDRER